MSSPALSVIKSDAREKWQEILADLITDPKELISILDLDPTHSSYAEVATQGEVNFPLRVPRPFAERMELGNWNDPLLRQVWPSTLENSAVDGLTEDPLQEQSFNPAPGLLHKYGGRVLLTAAPHCAIHCRYCFRRHFDYEANTPGKDQWQKALDYVRQDDSIKEVILSGGDPLAASDSYLFWLLAQIDGIAHVETVRIHTRLPIVIPQRMTPGLRKQLVSLRCKAVMVVHCNHAQEIDSNVERCLREIRRDGITLLNQTVLLRHVNADAESLISLSKRLFAADVLPYYLHFPDKVSGTGHFAVTESEAFALVEAMRCGLPGYLVPRLVREDPGESGKTRLA